MAQKHETFEEITELLARVGELTFFGLKAGVSSNVAHYMKKKGFDIIGVNPKKPETSFPMFGSMKEAPSRETLVMFRRSDALMDHLEEVLEYDTNIVWLQLGIDNDAFTKALVAAGIDVVANHCIKIEYGKRHR